MDEDDYKKQLKEMLKTSRTLFRAMSNAISENYEEFIETDKYDYDKIQKIFTDAQLFIHIILKKLDTTHKNIQYFEEPLKIEW